jgi:hypothetical protein
VRRGRRPSCLPNRFASALRTLDLKPERDAQLPSPLGGEGPGVRALLPIRAAISSFDECSAESGCCGLTTSVFRGVRAAQGQDAGVFSRSVPASSSGFERGCANDSTSTTVRPLRGNRRRCVWPEGRHYGGRQPGLGRERRSRSEHGDRRKRHGGRDRRRRGGRRRGHARGRSGGRKRGRRRIRHVRRGRSRSACSMSHGPARASDGGYPGR